MIPYFAIIKDSFREAIASRVLWLIFIALTIILAAIAPLTLVERAAYQLSPSEFNNPQEFVRALISEGQAEELTPSKHIWRLLPEDLTARLSEEVTGNASSRRRGLFRRLTDELNQLMQRPEFYDQDAWQGYVVSASAKEMLAKPIKSLDREEIGRRNRLVFDAAYSDFVSDSVAKAMYLKYAFYQFETALPMTADQAGQIVRSLVSGSVTLIVGYLGIFVTIIVTASIVPQTFEHGAIDLLLSKPVSRSFLLVTKFFGGCAFITLMATYFMVGLWLIVGLRYDVWMDGLWQSIPLFLFWFAIYYSVSTLCGVVWRNAIVSVVMAIIFWGVCFFVGAAKSIWENIFLNSSRAAVVMKTNEGVIVTNKSGESFEWLDESNDWGGIFRKPPGGPPNMGANYPLLGPVYDGKTDRLIAVSLPFRRPGRRGMSFGGGAGNLVVGTAAESWKRKAGVAIPRDMNAMYLDSQQKLVLVGPGGIQRFSGDPGVEHVPFKVFGFDLGKTNDAGKFVNLSPDVASEWQGETTSAINRQNDSIAVYSDDTIYSLARDKDADSESAAYQLIQSKTIDKDLSAIGGIAGGVIALAFQDATFQAFDAQTLEPVTESLSLDKELPKAIVGDPNGKTLAIVTHNGSLWVYDIANKELSQPSVQGQGNISAASITSSNSILVADRYPRVLEYELESFKIQSRYEPERSVPELIYHWGVEPLYTVFPKPGELNNMVNYLLTDNSSSALDGHNDTLQAERVIIDIWTPIWSNLAFLAAMLLCGCIYVSRKDF